MSYRKHNNYLKLNYILKVQINIHTKMLLWLVYMGSTYSFSVFRHLTLVYRINIVSNKVIQTLPFQNDLTLAEMINKINYCSRPCYTYHVANYGIGKWTYLPIFSFFSLLFSGYSINHCLSSAAQTSFSLDSLLLSSRNYESILE